MTAVEGGAQFHRRLTLMRTREKRRATRQRLCLAALSGTFARVELHERHRRQRRDVVGMHALEQAQRERIRRTVDAHLRAGVHERGGLDQALDRGVVDPARLHAQPRRDLQVPCGEFLRTAACIEQFTGVVVEQFGVCERLMRLRHGNRFVWQSGPQSRRCGVTSA